MSSEMKLQSDGFNMYPFGKDFEEDHARVADKSEPVFELAQDPEEKDHDSNEKLNDHDGSPSTD